MGASQVGRKHPGLRDRMGRFARLRSANRALPATASDMPGAEQREQRATGLRERLSELAALEAPAEELESELVGLDAELGEIEADLLTRFDALPFVSLRAAVPRAVESHRREVVALLEVLLLEREGLLERLPQVEYLITMLSTDEVDGRRNIVHDPVSLTPLLEQLPLESFDAHEAEAVAMKLYQAATLDSDSENFAEVLRSIRAEKQAFGLGCLAPVVLRAVITYNARMFNSVESIAEASRASDSVVDEALSAIDEELEEAETPTTEEVPSDEEPDLADEDEVGESAEPVSVFESSALGSVLEAMRARIGGATIGRRGPAERIAIVLDMGSLDAVERAAICSESPDQEQRIVARTTVVGLMVRDVGPLRGELAKLGVEEDQLADAWVRELNEAFGQLISEKLGDATAYELASKLSGIKSKHLLKPFNAINAGKRSGGPSEAGGGLDATAEMRRVAQSAAAEATAPGRKSAVAGAAVRKPGTAARGGVTLGEHRNKVIAAAALVVVAVGMIVVNVLGIAPSDIEKLGLRSLSKTSPYLQSAYRNEKGNGGLLVGRVDAAFESLPLEGKIAAANEMVESFEIQGIREAMLYDARGRMQVHYMAGELRRPRPGNRSSSKQPGQGAVRGSLMAAPLDEAMRKANRPEDEDDFWAEDDS